MTQTPFKKSYVSLCALEYTKIPTKDKQNKSKHINDINSDIIL